MKRKAVVLAVLILGVPAATALAANVTGDGTLVGSSGSDKIAAGNGNDTIWGLGAPNNGQDVISAGTGNDQIDGGGECMGVQAGDYPNGLNTGSCEQGMTPGHCGQEVIQAGTGDDTIYGNCGENTISVGSGMDFVYGYGGPNNIRVGNGQDVIDLTGETTGPNNIITGTGNVTVYAQNGQVDNVTCGSNKTVVYVDSKLDKTSKNCTRKTAPAVDKWGSRHTVRAHSGRAHRKSRLHKTKRRGHSNR